MTTSKIKDIKKGEFFMVKDSKVVYIRGDYERSLKKYSAIRADDANSERFFKADKEVIIGFTY